MNSIRIINFLLVFLLIFMLGCANNPSGHNRGVSNKEITQDEKINMHLIRGAHFGDLKMINEALDNGADIHWKTSGQSAIHHAVIFQNPEALTLLISRGANPNQLEDAKDNKLHPLFYSAMHRNLKITKILIDAGAKDSSDNGEYYSLSIALDKQQVPMVRLLLERGFSPNFIFAFSNDITPLMGSLINKNNEIFDLLLKYKADVNAKSDKNFTALHIAADYKNVHAIKQLLKAGAITNIKDHKGRTAEDILKSLGLSELLKYKK